MTALVVIGEMLKASFNVPSDNQDSLPNGLYVYVNIS